MYKTPHSLLALALAVLLASSRSLLAVEPAPGPTHLLPSEPAEARDLIANARLIHDVLVLLYEKSSDKDTQFYEENVWHFVCPKNTEGRMSGPSRAAATLWNWQNRVLAAGVLPEELKAQATPEKQQWLHRVAVDPITRLIKDYQNPDGSFQERMSPTTYFFAVELASTYLQLRDSLDDATRQFWIDALKKEVNYLEVTNNLPNLEKGTGGWYTNGNIELGEAEMLYKTWLATGEQRYKDLFERQWSHTMEPNQERWKGFGLIYSKQPTQPDGSDGEGYLAESGGGAPGYDASYGGVQLSTAAALFVTSRDPRVLRLLNLLLNTAMPRVDQTLWTYDASGGARKNYKGMFTTPALAIAAYHAGRADLKELVPAQFTKSFKGQYTGMAVQNWNSSNFYLGMGTELSVLLEPYLPAPVSK